MNVYVIDGWSIISCLCSEGWRYFESSEGTWIPPSRLIEISIIPIGSNIGVDDAGQKLS